MAGPQQSPVSPIEMTSIQQTQLPPTTTTTEPPTRQSSNATSNSNATWLPFTFQWYFLIVPFIASLTLGIIIIILIWYSQKNHGLGGDDGSSAILFGWRFTPTLLAVLYTQMTVILFEDAKRTEPFARLAKAPTSGANADGTVLQTPRAWWAVFADALRRKKTHTTSWCLFCTAFINVLALLAISPLSSALLTSEEVTITNAVRFSRTVPKNGTKLAFEMNRETYFRTMAGLTRNTSSSAWITDDSVTLPFWPSTEEAQLDANIFSQFKSWTAETTTLQPKLDCLNLTLQSANLAPRRYLGYDVLDHGPYRGTERMVEFNLLSEDGCHYELAVHPAIDLAYSGGIRWSNASTYYLRGERVLQLGRIPFQHNVSDTSPYVQFKASPECRDREIILISTPWTVPFEFNIRESIPFNKTYQRSPDFRMHGYVCEARATAVQQNVTATMLLDGRPAMQKSIAQHNLTADALVDISEFQSASLHSQWTNYFSFRAVNRDADRAMGGFDDPYAEQDQLTTTPGFTGMGPLLGSLYAFNITAALDDKQLLNQISRAKGRFFTESLRSALSDPQGVSLDTIDGQVTLVQERVVVLKEIGIALAVLFLFSTVLFGLVFWASRLHFRPLNLRTDPSSTVGLSLLLGTHSSGIPFFRSHHRSVNPEFHRVLRSETYYSTNGSLHTGSGRNWSYPTGPAPNEEPKRWHPFVIRLRMLFALCVLLAAILVAVLVLNSFSARSRLSQVAFIYEADVSKLGLSFSSFAPISIAPTVISVVIGLWWDQIDMTFRILQPYIAMSRRATPICTGAGLTYRSKTWAGAAIKAGRNKHWLLLMIAVGSVWCQILTVSMSALFERQQANVSQNFTLEQNLQIRQDPILTTVQVRDYPQSHWQDQARDVLLNLLLNPAKNWIPGATIQTSLNGTKLPWTHDEWSFLPFDLSRVPDSKSVQSASGAKSDNRAVRPTNVTVRTSAIRARLDCSPIPEVANAASWIIHPDPDWEGRADYGLERYNNSYAFNGTMFDGSPSNTSVFGSTALINCCANDTANGTTNAAKQAVMGFWSPTNAGAFPFEGKKWPMPFVTKWIVGKPRELQPIDPFFSGRLLVFEEMPSLQAARCAPIIETADVNILVDKDTSVIHSHEIRGSITATQSAWSEAFMRHQVTRSARKRNSTQRSSPQRYNETYVGPLNLTASFGVLFMDTMFRAADNLESESVGIQALNNNAFLIRDENHGLNMDLMTYSMYSLVDKDPRALLNYTTLVEKAGQTFSTFFQHFVQHELSLKQGGLTYQNMDDHSLDGIGAPLDINGTELPQAQYASPKSSQKVEALVSNRIQVLHMNTIATYLTVAILIWLIGTTAVVTCLQRKYTALLVRDVQLIADVLVLVAGSDNFLRLIEQQGIALKKNRDVKTMLGWFRDSDGQVRWGVEVVGGRNAVEWVDPPKISTPTSTKPTAKSRFRVWPTWLTWKKN